MSAAPRRYEDLDGSDKAAVLLMCLPSDGSANVLRQLPESQVERITSRMLEHEQVSPEAQEQLLREAGDLAAAHEYVIAGGIPYAQRLLSDALGAERAQELIDRLMARLKAQPFHYLGGVEGSQIATFLHNEHPQTIALVLSHLNARQSADILTLLPEKLQPQVSLRLANMGAINPATITQVETALKKKLSTVLDSESRSKTGGVEFLVKVLTNVDRGTERSIMEDLDTVDPELAADIKRQMFMFENLVQLDDRSIQRVLRDVDSRDLALALRGANPLVRDKVFANMSSRAADNVREEIEASPPVRLRTIEEAQQRIVDVVRRLEEDEEITVSRGGDDVLL
jgi:flagellar motor switch protein FliG